MEPVLCKRKKKTMCESQTSRKSKKIWDTAIYSFSWKKRTGIEKISGRIYLKWADFISLQRSFVQSIYRFSQPTKTTAYVSTPLILTHSTDTHTVQNVCAQATSSAPHNLCVSPQRQAAPNSAKQRQAAPFEFIHKNWKWIRAANRLQTEWCSWLTMKTTTSTENGNEQMDNVEASRKQAENTYENVVWQENIHDNHNNHKLNEADPLHPIFQCFAPDTTYIASRDDKIWTPWP